MKSGRRVRLDIRWLAVALATVLVVTLACAAEVREVPVERIVTQEVVKTVEVPGATVIQEVVKEVPVDRIVTQEVVKTVEVPGATVIKEVVKTVEVPGATVIKEVVKTVEVPGQTVIQEVVKEVPREIVRVERVGGAEGEIIVVIEGIPAVSGWTSNCGSGCYWTTLMNVTETLLHGGKDANGLPAYRGKVVESWEYAPDFSHIDWTVKRGNHFHQGFGEVTAEDVLYTYNEGDPRFASEETKALAESVGVGTVAHRGLPEPWMGKLELLDQFKFRMPLLNGRPEVNGLFQFTDDSYPVGIYSKRAFEEMGWEWVRDNIVGSGPYEYEEMDSDVKWSMIARNDPENEDEKIPFVYRWEILNIPDENVRLAMYKGGQAHRAWFDTPAIGIDLLNEGHSKTVPNGGKASVLFTFMGNYWESVEGQTGEPLEREARGQIGNGGDEYPWICPPGPNPMMPEVSDCNNVAKKFRRAMFMGIDRRSLLTALYGGRGSLLLSPNANLGDPFILKHGDRWGDAYNPDAAKALFEEWKSEYTAMGGNSDKVKVSAWIGTSGRKEVTEAVLSHWESLFGIKWEMDNTPQASWAPGAWRGREGWQLVRDAALTYRGNSMLWDVERWHTSLGQPGSRNEGTELLKATETILDKGEAWNDPAKQEQLTLDWMDWFYDQHIATGVLEGQNVTDLYRSDYIETWTTRVPGVPWILWDPEYVTLRK